MGGPLGRRFPSDFFESFLRIGISKSGHFLDSISKLGGRVTLSRGRVKEGVYMVRSLLNEGVIDV